MFAEFVVLRYTAAEQIHYVQHWLLGNREVWCAKMRLSHFLNFYNEYILILQLNKRKMLKDLFLKEFPSPFTLLLKSKHKSRQHPPTPTPTPCDCSTHTARPEARESPFVFSLHFSFPKKVKATSSQAQRWSYPSLQGSIVHPKSLISFYTPGTCSGSVTYTVFPPTT